MPDFHYQKMFVLGPDETEYRLLTDDGVEVVDVGGREVLRVDPKALRILAAEAIRDVSYLFRPSHLQQLRNILDDPEASDNDRFVALQMLRNANVSAGMLLPSCQDTGTAIVMAHKGEDVFTGADDAEWLSHGIYDTYTGSYLRYS
jgi:fumarate hydratase class I